MRRWIARESHPGAVCWVLQARVGHRDGGWNLYPRWVRLVHRRHPPIFTDLCYHQRQSLHRPVRGSERTHRTRTHVRTALSTHHAVPTHRSGLSPSSETEPQGVGVYATVLERVRQAERGELYSHAFAECGDGDVVVGGGLFRDFTSGRHVRSTGSLIVV